MNRRELFHSVVATAAASGVTVEASTYAGETKPALAVFESDQMLSDETCARIAKTFMEYMKGTPFEGVKAVVLGEGFKMTLLDSTGRVLNRRLEGED